MPRIAATVLLGLACFAAPAAGTSPALPDAKLLGINVEGSDFHAGDLVLLTIRVRNTGDAPLPSAPVTLSIGGDAYAEWKLPSKLAPGETATWPVRWAAVRGSHLVKATVDPLNDVIETDEMNNAAFVNIGVAEAPDPFPWPPIIAGVCAFSVGAACAVLLRRLRPRNSGRSASSYRSAGRATRYGGQRHQRGGRDDGQ
jgi:hypothetical protein